MDKLGRRATTVAFGISALLCLLGKHFRMLRDKTFVCVFGLKLILYDSVCVLHCVVYRNSYYIQC